MTDLEKRIEAAIAQALANRDAGIADTGDLPLSQYLTRAIMPIVQPNPQRTARMGVIKPPLQFLKPEEPPLVPYTLSPRTFDIETLPARIDKALETRQLVDPLEKVNFNGVNMSIKDLPSQDHRAMMGYGHFVFPHADQIIPRPDGVEWPYTPSTCQVSSGKRNQTPLGVWLDDQHLVCPGCGLDCT